MHINIYRRIWTKRSIYNYYSVQLYRRHNNKDFFEGNAMAKLDHNILENATYPIARLVPCVKILYNMRIEYYPS